MWKRDSIGFSAWLSRVLAAERSTRTDSPSASDRTYILEPDFPGPRVTDLQVRPSSSAAMGGVQNHAREVDQVLLV